MLFQNEYNKYLSKTLISVDSTIVVFSLIWFHLAPLCSSNATRALCQAVPKPIRQEGPAPGSPQIHGQFRAKIYSQGKKRDSKYHRVLIKECSIFVVSSRVGTLRDFPRDQESKVIKIKSLLEPSNCVPRLIV